MNTAIHTKSGHVSAYGLACGYQEQRQITPNVYRQLYREGGYHVRTFDDREAVSPRWVRWQTFDVLSDARKAFMESAS